MRELNHLKADKRGWRAVVKNKPWCLEELYLCGFEINSPDGDGLTPFRSGRYPNVETRFLCARRRSRARS